MSYCIFTVIRRKHEKDFFEILSKLKDRIWIPHQVAYEYQKNRLYVIAAQIKAYEDIEKILITNFYELRTELFKDYKRHPFINTQEIVKDIEQAIEQVRAKIQSIKLNHPNYLDVDELRDRLTDLLEGKVVKHTQKKN